MEHIGMLPSLGDARSLYLGVTEFKGVSFGKVVEARRVAFFPVANNWAL